MLTSSNAGTGMVLALAIAVLATAPRIIRLDADQFAAVGSHAVYLFFSMLGCWFLHHGILRYNAGRWLCRTPVRAVLSIAAGTALVVALTALYKYAEPSEVFMPVQNLHGVQVAGLYVFRAAVISGCSYIAVYYFRMVLLWQQSTVENARLRQEQLATALASLRQQLSPHFLFNALNTLVALSHEEVVREYTARLADVYRYVLRVQDRDDVPLRDELEFLRSYLYILETRFEAGLRVTIDVRESSLDRRIVPLALQLLVENAVKHNSTSAAQPLVVHIADSGDSIVVSNGYQPRRTAEPGTGVGLRNLERRYSLAARKQITVTGNEQTFAVALPLLP